MTTIIRSPYRDGVYFSVPTSKLNPTLVLSLLINQTGEGRPHFSLDVSERPPDHEHAHMIQWLSNIADRLDEALMRYCQAWIALILLHHLWCTPEDEVRRALRKEVCLWISNRLNDSNTLRLDSMLFATSVMLSDEEIHASYVQHRNFSLASVGKLKKTFAMNADKMRELLKRAESRELTTAQLVQLANTIDGGAQQVQENALEPARTVQLIDDHDAESYSVLWTGGTRHVWVPKDDLRRGAAQWRAMADAYEQTLIEQARAASTANEAQLLASNKDAGQTIADQNQHPNAAQQSLDEASSIVEASEQRLAVHQADSHLLLPLVEQRPSMVVNQADSPLLLLTAVEGHQHHDESTSAESSTTLDLHPQASDAPSRQDTTLDELTRENATLRRQVEEMKVQAQLCAAAETDKLQQLLKMNSALREDLRVSERERQRLHRLLKQNGRDTCSSAAFTLPSMLRVTKKRKSTRLQPGLADGGEVEVGQKKQACEAHAVTCGVSLDNDIAVSRLAPISTVTPG